MMKILKSTPDVIEALGGTKGACDLLKVTEQSVSGWRTKNAFPAHTFATIQEALLGIGLTANVGLWRFERKRRAVR